MRDYSVAVVGATGAVGGELLKILEDRQFPLAELRLFASERSAGEMIGLARGEVRVDLLDPDGFHGVDLAFFCAGGAISAEYAPLAVSGS